MKNMIHSHKTKLAVCIALLIGGSMSLQAGEPKNISKLWMQFVQAQKNHTPSILRDFSYAGYHHGEDGIPDVNYPKIDITKYGAVANDGKSDREAFIKAIKVAEETAVTKGGAIIYIPEGTFRLHNANEPNETISIKGSNIVLRGEDRNKSILFMEAPNETTTPDKKWTGPVLIQFIPSNTISEVVTKITKSAAVGEKTVNVISTKGLKIGQYVAVHLKDSNDSLIAQTVAPLKLTKKWAQLWDRGVMIESFHQIVSLTSNSITFKEPLMTPIDIKWPWGITTQPKLAEVGVENLTFLGDFHEKFVHHKNWLHDSGYCMVKFRSCVDSWMRNLTFRDVSSAAGLDFSANCSILNCKVEGYQGHSSINNQEASRTLMANIYDKSGQWHSVGVSKPSIGSVLWRIKSTPNTCFESHSSQPRYTLIDNWSGGFMKGHGGGAVGSLPTHLEGLVLWNYEETDAPEMDFDFVDATSPYWRVLPPIIVGFHAPKGQKCSTFNQKQVKYEEFNGQEVLPISLYEAQLKLRLGKLPEWAEVLINQPVTDQ
ncbi:MAG: DUF4955 domain-containing protein [Bacteroidaceae bacterium]